MSDPLSLLRPVRDADADALTALIGAAYAEHPGCVLDLPGVDADLCAPASSAARTGGRWWVLDGPDGSLAASVARGPVRGTTVELKRLYVAAGARRRGLGAALIAHVERDATAAGARTVELWSDTRFLDAHRRYEALGYADTGERRDLHDPSATTERRFVRPLGTAG